MNNFGFKFIQVKYVILIIHTDGEIYGTYLDLIKTKAKLTLNNICY